MFKKERLLGGIVLISGEDVEGPCNAGSIIKRPYTAKRMEFKAQFWAAGWVQVKVNWPLRSWKCTKIRQYSHPLTPCQD